MINIIAAVSSNGVIGLNNSIPFYYKSDLKNFKKLTTNSTIIMGRKTFESIGKTLPNRKNIVISSTNYDSDDFITFNNLKDSLEDDCWLIGGRGIYEEGMQYADCMYITVTPDIIKDSNAVYFPFINPLLFEIEYTDKDTLKEDNLTIFKYRKIK